jgi:hypothetical protein
LAHALPDRYKVPAGIIQYQTTSKVLSGTKDTCHLETSLSSCQQLTTNIISNNEKNTKIRSTGMSQTPFLLCLPFVTHRLFFAAQSCGLRSPRPVSCCCRALVAAQRPQGRRFLRTYRATKSMLLVDPATRSSHLLSGMEYCV